MLKNTKVMAAWEWKYMNVLFIREQNHLVLNAETLNAVLVQEGWAQEEVGSLSDLYWLYSKAVRSPSVPSLISKLCCYTRATESHLCPHLRKWSQAYIHWAFIFGSGHRPRLQFLSRTHKMQSIYSRKESSDHFC